MFTGLKTFFGITAPTPQPSLSFTTTAPKEKNMFARIDADNNLYSPTGEFIGSYSRRRDAVRGAKRRGFALAN